jgi:hypothetical protein
MSEAAVPGEGKRRSLRVAEGVLIVAILAVSGQAIQGWKAEGIQVREIAAHGGRLDDHEGRLDTIEGAAVVVHLAQATERLEKLEAGAEVTAENQTAIAGITATQVAQGDQLRRIEDGLATQTGLIIRALQSAPREPPSVPPAARVTTDPSP